MAKPNPLQKVRTMYGWWLALAGLAAVAVLYRLLQWRVLPPGLSANEAHSAVASAAGAKLSLNYGLDQAVGFSPLWLLLTHTSIGMFGHTITAVRIVAVIISLLGLIVTFLWAKAWFDRRTAYVATLLMAIMPWSVTLSRDVTPTILAPLSLGLLLWTLAGLVRRPNSLLWVGGLTASVIFGLKVGPWGWYAIVITILVGLVQRKALIRTIKQLAQHKLMSAALTVVGFGSIIATVLIVLPHLADVAAILKVSPAWPSQILQVIGMFFYRGDPDFTHNLGGEPMLNAFVALAFVAGLIVLMSRYLRARDRAMVLLLVLGLLPAILGGGLAPNAANAALALPVICVIAAVGVFFLLDLWTATFPVNSAARSLGQTAIGLLLALTAYQGYTQYYVAWANSSETYIAYNRPAVATAIYAKAHPEAIIVAGASELDVVHYLLPKAVSVQPTALETFDNASSYTFIITAMNHDTVVPLLEKRFAGGTIKPHLDADGSELYYDYAYIKK